MKTLRIGAVSYLNTRPLVAGLDHGPCAERTRLSFDVPSELSRQLAAGQLEVALLPVIELARIPDLEIVPGLGITCHGASRSVLLISRCPAERINTLALDPESRTSNALAQVLLKQVWNTTPVVVDGGAELRANFETADAAVRIGDKALFEPVPEGMNTYDLSQVWTEATGLPFVFAVWAARPACVDQELYRWLHASRRIGARQIDAIADEFRWRGARDPDRVRQYLNEHIRYRLGGSEVEALNLFFRLAHAGGLIDGIPELRMALERRTRCNEVADRLASG